MLRHCFCLRGAALVAGTLLLSGLAARSEAGTGVWTTSGPTGGTVPALAADPTSSSILYAGTLGGGVLRSADGGATWSPASSGLDDPKVNTLAIDPTTTTTLYAGTASGGIFQSTNSGTSWSAANTGLTNLEVRTLAVDPTTTSTLYAGTAAGVFKSTNSGASWSAANTGLTSSDIAVLAIDPTTTSTLYAGTMSGGVFQSTDSGGSWSAVNTGLTDLDVRALVVDPTTSTTLYAATDGGGIFKSTTIPISWSASNTGLGNTVVQALAIDPVTPATLYAGTDGGGVYQSTDSGGSWSAFNTGLGALEIRALATDPLASGPVYAGTLGGGVFSYSALGMTWSEANTGLGAAQVRALAIDAVTCPTTCPTLYAGTSGGAFKSGDGGGSWADSSTGLTTTDIQALTIDRVSATTLYAGTSFGGGVFKSSNSGATWTDVTTVDLTNTDIRSLVIDVGSPDLVYAATGGGVFEYDDSSGTWTDLTTAGLTDTDVRALAVDLLDADLLYAGTADGIFRRDDSTGAWTDLTTADLGVTEILAVAVDPTDSAILYVGTAGAAVFKSEDGGATWTASSFGLEDPIVQSLAIDPLDPSTLYAGSESNGVYVSGDSADTWDTDNPGLDNLDILALVVDPSSSLELHAGSNGGGVFDLTQSEAALSITKDNGVTTAMPAETVVYTITVSNGGPDAVTGATVNDLFPDEVSSVSWTCTASAGSSCTAGPVAGDIDDSVDLLASGTATYTATATIDPAATGLLFNSASVSPPGGVYDADRSDNTDNDTDTLIPTTDLAITKDDGATTAVPGEMVTYTIVVSNNGPLDAVDATVSDEFPADLTACSWSCVPTGGGACTTVPTAGDIDDTVDLPVGDTLTYTATCTVDPAATGDLENTAEVSPPSGTTDSDTANDEATDTDTLTPESDLAITKDDSVTSAVPGGSVTYVIEVSNNGPSDAEDAVVTDLFPAELSCETDCVASGEASCSSITITGDITDTVDLPVGETLTYTAVCDIASSAMGSLVNTASVAPAAGLIDPVSANDSATDTDALAGEADLSISKDDGVDSVSPGELVTYTITAANAGPSDAVGTLVEDLFPADLACTWSCEAAGGAVCTGPAIQALAIKPNSSSTLFAGTDAGLFRSLDSADSWEPSESGLGSTDIRALAFDPDTTSTLYAGTAGGVFRSANIGSSWSEVNSGLGDLDVRALAIDPGTPTTLYAGTGSGVFQTTDSGGSWSDVGTGDLTNTDIRALVIDSMAPDLLYAGTGGGVFRRDEATGVWTDLTTGDLTSTDVQALALDPADSDLLYAGTSGGIFRRDEASGDWTDLTTGDLTSSDVRAVVVDAADSAILYLATADGVFQSIDSGTSWTAVRSGLSSLDLQILVADPNDEDTLYTGGAGGGVFASGDAAASWAQASTGITSEASGDIADTVTLPADSTATYTAECTVSTAATGSLVNTATVTAPAGVSDPDAGNDSATDTDTLEPLAGLSISKDDGLGAAVPGSSTTYTITAANDGPSDAFGATVEDLFPAGLTCDWTCAASGAATCTAGPVAGDIVDSVDLPAGDSVTYTATCSIASSAVGTLENTATITEPAGVTDSDSSDNSATDSNSLTPEADLSIGKDNGVTVAVPGSTTTYTVTVSNAGPSDVSAAAVSDLFPAELACTWTCAPTGGGSCTAGPVAGDIDDSVDLPVGATAVYTAVCAIDLDAEGTLTNTAAVAAPAGTTDPDGSNDSDSDADTLEPSADLSIAKDDGLDEVTPGQSVSYAITVANAGPSNAFGSVVNDTFPTELTGVTWTCAASGGAACTAAGSGDIAESVDLPPGGSVLFTATGTVDTAALGDLVNTATVATPAGTSDPDSGNDSATDTDTIFVEADLEITKDDGQTSAEPGQPVTYTITVTNNGPQQVTDAVVTDIFPADLLAVSWTCFAAGGSSCTEGPVAGDIADTVFLPAGSSVVYTATGTLDSGAAGDLSNTATVSAPAGVTDPDSDNNSATDVDSLDPQADLEMSVEGPAETVRGFPIAYTLTTLNSGPDDVTAATVVDTFPAEVVDVSWTCTPSPGASCSTDEGSGDINETVDLEAGASVVFSVTGTVDAAATSSIVNTALTLPPGEVIDPDAGNNSDTVSTDPIPGADLAIAKDDGQETAPVDDPLIYTIEVVNNGALDIVGAEVVDFFPPELSDCSWTCAPTGGASCNEPGEDGDIVDTVDLPVGDTVTYTATCSIVEDGVTILNTALVTMPPGQVDPIPENDSSTDQTLAVLFADGFESGDTSAWSGTSGESPVATLRLPSPGDLYRGSFEVDSTALDLMPSGPARILHGRGPLGVPLFELEARRGVEGPEHRASVHLGDGAWVRSRWVSWGGSPETLDLEWRVALPADQENGAFQVTLDRTLRIWLTELDNAESPLLSLDFYAFRGYRILYPLDPTRDPSPEVGGGTDSSPGEKGAGR